MLASADEEIAEGKRQLFFSGLIAGFAISLTVVGHAVGAEVFPENGFLSAILYPIGFIYIILGNYQLYTENTLPPVALTLSRLASVPLLVLVWTVVLVGNVLGAGFGVFLVAHGNVLSPEAMTVATEFAGNGLELGWWTVFTKALFAGWLVAGVVWLDHAAQDSISRLLVIYFIFYTIAAGELYHVITAAGEAFLFLFVTGSNPIGVMMGYWLPVLLGNTVGGVLLFTLVNYVKTDPDRFPNIRVLTTRELLFSWRGGEEAPPSPRGRGDPDAGDS